MSLQPVHNERLTLEEFDAALVADIGALAEDFLGLVMYLFPWRTDRRIQVARLKEPWASRYESEYGPDAWACTLLDRVSEKVRKHGFDGQTACPPIREAIASGHGIGKSAMMAWIANALMSRGPSKGIVTANTGNQLRTKTFAEMSKWFKLAINAHWFDIVTGDMSVRAKADPDNWRVDCITWKKEQSEAFAGLHLATGTPWYGFDESSAIPDNIAEVAEGGLTDGEPFFFKFGNPTQNVGHFHRAFHGDRKRWHTTQIDSRDVQVTNKKLLQEWVDDYGEDSDFVRIRVKGVFPRTSARQFISSEWVQSAREREPERFRSDPVILGVDPARGGDESVIAIRSGFDARTWEWGCYRLDDTTDLVGLVVQKYEELKKEGWPMGPIFIDAHGLGAPIFDTLAKLGLEIIPCYNVAMSRDQTYAKTGDKWWGDMREWLRSGAIPRSDEVLATQLTQRETGFDSRNRIALESKDAMERRGLESPDRADALALTFAHPVQPSADHPLAALSEQKRHHTPDWDPLEVDF